MPPALFALVILEKGSHFLPLLAWTLLLLFLLPAVAGMAGTWPQVIVYLLRWGLMNFLPWLT
jgi:hypothetical protein